MFDRVFLAVVAFYVLNAIRFKILGLILPTCVTDYYSWVASTFLYLIISRFQLDYEIIYFVSKKIRLENRAILITGCDSGFGHALAKRLDSIGFHVFASCLFPDGKGAYDLKKQCSKQLQILELNVKEDESVKKAVKSVKENLGASEFWALVNNAGVLKGFDVELTSMDDFKEMFEVNTFGPVRMAKAFLPLLKQSKGRVVNVTSIVGRLTLPFVTPYSMSKSAAVAFSEGLKQEMDVWGVKVISVEPEMFSTQMTNSDVLTKTIDKSFSCLNDEEKFDYGETYLKDFRRLPEFSVGLASSNISAVVDALEAAVSLEHPRSVYKPCRNVFMKGLLYVSELVPRSVIDLVIKVACDMHGFPKPQAVAPQKKYFYRDK